MKGEKKIRNYRNNYSMEAPARSNTSGVWCLVIVSYNNYKHKLASRDFREMDINKTSGFCLYFVEAQGPAPWLPPPLFNPTLLVRFGILLFLNLYRSGMNVTVEWIKICTWISTIVTQVLRGFSESLHVNGEIVPQMRTIWLPSISFQMYEYYS